ncbi:PQQ-dependent sugar dehydrogenase [Candidatus Acetothermia bacterium]|nr:PQQ-dependent sugar dehydrogenase [Candidatus Acetothermia bacterium]
MPIGKKIVLLAVSLSVLASCSALPTGSQINSAGVGLKLVAEGFTAPTALAAPEDGTGRLFIVDQIGVIKVLTPDGKLSEDPFLDLRDRVVKLSDRYDERGLLGLAFHQDFKKNGRFFVYYSAPLRSGGPQGWNHTSHISEFKVSSDNPNKADPKSERIVLEVDEPQANHNGGQLAFGPDGYLYISLGDGGAANDVGLGHSLTGNGQDLSTLLGKILRIDVNASDPYGIPADNPFVGQQGARAEIFAYGFRNPYRFSFDAGANHDLFVADVGQNLFEEVDIVTRGGNYGWNTKEGTHCFDPKNPNQPLASCSSVGARGEPLVGPIIEYDHKTGIAVVGGFIYRGSALPQFGGRYILGDWSTSSNRADGKLFMATAPASTGAMWAMEELKIATTSNGKLGRSVLAFGQDADRELYVLTSEKTGPAGNTGKIFKIVPAP